MTCQNTEQKKAHWSGSGLGTARPCVCVVPLKHNTGLFTEGKNWIYSGMAHTGIIIGLCFTVHTQTHFTLTSAACYHHFTQREIHSFTIMLTQYHTMRLDNWIIALERYINFLNNIKDVTSLESLLVC